MEQGEIPTYFRLNTKHTILIPVISCFFIGMCLFAWRNNSNLTTNNANNGNVGRRDFEAAGALGVLCVVTGITFVVDFFYVMYQNVLHAPEY